MPSFDVVSEVDMQEVKNALDQTRREVETRFDFRASKASAELEKDKIVVIAEDTLRLDALGQILKAKLAKRSVSLKMVTFEEPRKAGGDMLRQEVLVKQGLTDEELKRLSKMIKGEKFKVTAQIQESQLRVTGKKKDDLQEVIAFLRKGADDLELKFTNFRE